MKINYNPKAVDNYYWAVRAFYEEISGITDTQYRDWYIATMISYYNIQLFNKEFNRLFNK